MGCPRLTRSHFFQEDIAKLLRYESSALPAGQLSSLTEYASRMKAGSRNIYYLCAPNRHLAEHSPYFEAMKKKDTEVGERFAVAREDWLSSCMCAQGSAGFGAEQSSEACGSSPLFIPLSPLGLATAAWGQVISEGPMAHVQVGCYSQRHLGISAHSDICDLPSLNPAEGAAVQCC